MSRFDVEARNKMKPRTTEREGEGKFKKMTGNFGVGKKNKESTASKINK